MRRRGHLPKTSLQDSHVAHVIFLSISTNMQAAVSRMHQNCVFISSKTWTVHPELRPIRPHSMDVTGTQSETPRREHERHYRYIDTIQSTKIVTLNCTQL